MADDANGPRDQSNLDAYRKKHAYQRVLKEKRELDLKLARLTDFLCGAARSRSGVTEDELHRLRRQASVMREYSDILQQRIKAWS